MEKHVEWILRRGEEHEAAAWAELEEALRKESRWGAKAVQSIDCHAEYVTMWVGRDWATGDLEEALRKESR
jgi:hypothetical protein